MHVTRTRAVELTVSDSQAQIDVNGIMTGPRHVSFCWLYFYTQGVTKFHFFVDEWSTLYKWSKHFIDISEIISIVTLTTEIEGVSLSLTRVEIIGLAYNCRVR
jgi:hypothetical protein